MARRRKRAPRIEYVEVGFSHGYRWRIDPEAQQAVEYRKQGGIERMSGPVSLDTLIGYLEEARSDTE